MKYFFGILISATLGLCLSFLNEVRNYNQTVLEIENNIIPLTELTSIVLKLNADISSQIHISILEKNTKVSDYSSFIEIFNEQLEELNREIKSYSNLKSKIIFPSRKEMNLLEQDIIGLVKNKKYTLAKKILYSIEFREIKEKFISEFTAVNEIINFMRSQLVEELTRNFSQKYKIYTFLTIILFFLWIAMLSFYYKFSREYARVKAKEKENIDKIIKTQKTTEEALKVKSQFLANVNHEIRTPLNGIIGSADLLANSQLDIKQKKLVNILQRCGNTLLQLVNDVLDISKMESGKFSINKASFELAELIEEVKLISIPLIRDKEIDFIVNIDQDVPALMLSDEFRIKQILLNLLSNAFKFTAKGVISLQVCKKSKEAKDYILFEVKDNGIGIPRETQKHIFDRFIQADSSITKVYGGTGLGLNICKQLADILGGDIELSSDGQHGATFVVSIPFVEPSSQSIEQLNIEKSKANLLAPTLKFAQKYPINILLVEDNHINQKIALTFFKKIGIYPKVANNGQEAVDLCRIEKFDLILMDLQMPILGGIEASKIIRNKLNNQESLIVALTANTSEQFRVDCHQAGMNGFIEKPLKFDNIVNFIEAHFVPAQDHPKAS